MLGTFLWLLLGLVAFGLYLSWTAGRIDRLHARVDAARAALDAQLVRRVSVTQELASSGLLDPATSVLLATAGHDAREAVESGRELAESDLSRALRAAFVSSDPGVLRGAGEVGKHLMGELEAAVRRVEMARRFYNDTVRSAVGLRRQRLVRYLRLAGRAPMLTTFEMDDGPPGSWGKNAAL